MYIPLHVLCSCLVGHVCGYATAARLVYLTRIRAEHNTLNTRALSSFVLLKWKEGLTWLCGRLSSAISDSTGFTCLHVGFMGSMWDSTYGWVCTCVGALYRCTVLHLKEEGGRHRCFERDYGGLWLRD